MRERVIAACKVVLARLNLYSGGLNMMLGKVVRMGPCLVKEGAPNM